MNLLTKKKMDKFISLEEFLVLPDMSYSTPRENYKHWMGPEWVNRYNLAKTSWETHGDNGPPVGTEVVTLVNGHGGGGGNLRSFNGIYERDSRYFAIGKEISLVLVATWWREIVPQDILESMFGTRWYRKALFIGF